jgi:secreted PhoX family phosphatase
MNQPVDPIRIDFNDEDSNRSANPHFHEVLDARLSRRSLLRGGVGGATTAVLGSSLLAACGSDEPAPAPLPAPAPAPAPAASPTVTRLGFNAVPKSLADVVTVPAGYTATILYALGDPLRAATPAFKNDGTDTDFENRAGDHHDGMEWFGLSTTGTPSTTAVDRGLLAINHEATTDETRSSFFVHPTGGTPTLPRPVDETDKEMALHGISVVEVRKTGSAWTYLRDSSYNFRLTPNTEIDLAGPLRGNALAITKYSPTGTVTRGTLNNCGTGKTPWGTLLTGEENWVNYFFRVATDNALRGNDKSVTALNRYGRAAGAASRHGWETASADDRHQRFNISRSGVSVDGSDDYRHEMNLQGYVVEVDPYTKTRKAVKRSALGRFAHESAAFSPPVVGQPLAVYLGDDARNEYIYKFVSTALWSAADATPTDRLATGAKYLDQGTLYVAKFNADGTGQWVPLTMSNTTVRDFAGYPFADQADVLVNARLAGDAVGATKMDRPEWCAVNPKNGEIYFTLTNNSTRRVEPTGSQSQVDAANPRAYSDVKGSSTTNSGNVNGHLIRVKEGTGAAAATSFTWDVYLFGAEASASPSMVNLSGLTTDQDFSSPDGLAFSAATGVCWIETDDGAYTDVTNCMLLAALPGQVGDGGKKTLSYTRANGSTLNVDTYIGAKPTADTLKRFLVGPVDCEITGITETPDGKALFVNIQHPGELTRMADVTDPSKYTSQWPSNAGYGAGKRPRSATIVITKNDGGVIGA